MKTWSNGAKKRLAKIQKSEEMANDMQIIATAMAQLPPGQLKKVLTQDIMTILEKYGIEAK